MGREASDPIHLRVVLLKDQRVVAVHLGEVGPAVTRRFPHEIKLAGTISVIEVGDNQILYRDRACVAHCQRRVHDFAADGTPDGYDRKAPHSCPDPLFQRQDFETLLPRGLGVVVMDASSCAQAAAVAMRPKVKSGRPASPNGSDDRKCRRDRRRCCTSRALPLRRSSDFGSHLHQ
jgi:hypothetical protein